jgi:hypothetical protein
VTVRHAVLSIGAVLVLGLGVYLFVEVRSSLVSPAAAPVRTGETGEPGEPLATRARAAQPTRPQGATPPSAEVRGDAAPARPAAPPVPSAPPPALPGSAAASPEPELAGSRLDAAMAEANKAYDRGDYDDAKALAQRLLTRDPSNVRMLRILVSASCIDGDAAAALASYAKLPPADQAQMRTRCARYGVAFPDKP